MDMQQMEMQHLYQFSKKNRVGSDSTYIFISIKVNNKDIKKAHINIFFLP